MEKKYFYMTLVITYLITIFLVIIVEQILFIAFILLVLMFFHVVFFVSFQEQLESDKVDSLQEMQYELSKSVKYKDETHLRFTSLAEVLGSGLILIDEYEIIRRVNNYAKKTFELSHAEGNNYDILQNIKKLYQIIHQAFISEKETRGQIMFKARVFDVISAPIFEKDIYHGCVILLHDITLIKNAETFQKQFTADVTHELKTPLSALKGISEILLRDENIDLKKRHEFDHIIHSETRRLETIVNDLLTISKMDRLDYELTLKKHEIKSLIEDIITLFKPQIEDKGLALSYDIEEASVYIDGIKMQQVFSNLIKNALSYTDEGHIEIHAYNENDDYVFTVKDTGIGIAAENQESVFKRFYRIDEARSRASGGSGLGLSIIKNVVKKHQGKIELKSSLNEGSTFIVRFPKSLENQ